MRFILMVAGATVIASPVAAQQSQADVNSYLCTFAGKCGTDAASAVTPTKAAPATKGFHLAQAQPMIAAPATKGFHLAQASVQPMEAAPKTKGFHLASAVPTATRPASTRRFAGARPAATPGAARADLMLAFEYNSALMTPAAEAKAKTFAVALMNDALKDKRFLIEGHTDARGSRDANVDLSRRRAQSVADYLVTQGVDKDRVEVKGVGPDEPLPGHSAASEANRRVEAVLIS
ncbi:OmpA family protein [Sphingomonas bacterium]|uniref:OmpA family protein n=1 Tax=Sphingomonas bacterium TaxID=1895847 RepID=UPI0015773996|nr:OmpA family protein [Sphingomonas bacterium]